MVDIRDRKIPQRWHGLWLGARLSMTIVMIGIGYKARFWFKKKGECFFPGRRSIAYPCMDLEKSTDINMDIHDFWMSVLHYPLAWIFKLISKQGYPYKDILQWISVTNKYPWMDIHVFMDISLQLSLLLWIYLDTLRFLWTSMHWLAMDSRSRIITKHNYSHSRVLKVAFKM